MINYDDFIIKEAIRKKSRYVGEVSRSKYYKCSCLKCGKDRGYLSKSRYIAKPTCIKCSTNTMEHKNKLKKSHWSKTGVYSPPKLSSEEINIRKNRDLGYRRSYYKQYYQSNKDIIHKKRKQLESQNLEHRLAKRLRTRLVNAIRGNQKTGSAIRDLGCSMIELRWHLESKFQHGMSWNNYGRNGWHVDHIKPLSSFNLSDPEQLKIACHYTNLQPLWAQQNLKKSNKII